MSKGLEALKRIKSGTLELTFEQFYELFDIVEKELKRLEEYDKTEYSALIESHKKLLKEKKTNTKKLKALEIIKNKQVNCYDVINSLNYEHYLVLMKDYDNGWYLTQEEYDFLKEVLTHEHSKND